MASSEKSERLGLSLWAQTDKPEWSDFRQDNEKLEELAGAHLADQALHLTAEEKQFVSQPFRYMTHLGTGASRINYLLGNPRPTGVIAFANKRPACIPRTDGSGTIDTYFEYWFKPANTEYSTGGVIVDLTQGLIGFANGYLIGSDKYIYHRMNEKSVYYTVLLF